jgi:hypothetical protein
VILYLQSLGNYVKLRVFLPQFFAQFDKEGIGELDKYSGGPVACNLIIIDNLSLKDLIVGVCRCIIIVIFSQHFLFVDLVKIRPLESVIEIKTVNSKLLYYSHCFSQQ